MDIRREKQIIAAIAKEFQNQNNTLKIPVPADEVEQTAVDLADSLSMKLFIHSGRNGEASCRKKLTPPAKRTDNPAAIQTPPDNRRCLFF